MYLCRWKYSKTGDSYKRFCCRFEVVSYIYNNNITMKFKSPEPTVSVLWSWLHNLSEVKHFVPVHLQIYSIQRSMEQILLRPSWMPILQLLCLGKMSYIIWLYIADDFTFKTWNYKVSQKPAFNYPNLTTGRWNLMRSHLSRYIGAAASKGASDTGGSLLLSFYLGMDMEKPLWRSWVARNFWYSKYHQRL